MFRRWEFFYIFADENLNKHYKMNIAIYTLTSELHDEAAVAAVTKEFLSSMTFDYDFCGADFTSFGTHDLDLIYVRTGGTEGIFRSFYSYFENKIVAPVYLLTSGKSNSLAASMEILSYLRQQGRRGEIIHGTSSYINSRVALLANVERARRSLKGCRLGVIGQPSDWLIASNVDKDAVKKRLGIEIEDIPLNEVLDNIESTAYVGKLPPNVKDAPKSVIRSIPGAMGIYYALKKVVAQHDISGFTLRCFDLLKILRNTGCLALACLNKEGIVAGCEGDIPAMLSMTVSRALTGLSGFQANPSRIDVEKGEMIFAHCTIPLNMVDDFELDTHFESGIGVGIRGRMREGDVTVFKMSGDATRFFAEEGVLVRNQNEPDLCRTQQIIRLDNIEDTRYFLTCPIGNHHIIMPGRWKKQIEELLG